MFEPGEKVACVNGQFDATARRLYRNLPVQDGIYTVRAVTLGRTRTGSADKGFSYCVLLEEIVNDPDPYMHPDSAEELGFRSDRFAPLISEGLEAEAEMSIHAT